MWVLLFWFCFREIWDETHWQRNTECLPLCYVDHRWNITISWSLLECTSFPISTLAGVESGSTLSQLKLNGWHTSGEKQCPKRLVYSVHLDNWAIEMFFHYHHLHWVERDSLHQLKGWKVGWLTLIVLLAQTQDTCNPYEERGGGNHYTKK